MFVHVLCRMSEVRIPHTGRALQARPCQSLWRDARPAIKVSRLPEYCAGDSIRTNKNDNVLFVSGELRWPCSAKAVTAIGSWQYLLRLLPSLQ